MLDFLTEVWYSFVMKSEENLVPLRDVGVSSEYVSVVACPWGEQIFRGGNTEEIHLRNIKIIYGESASVKSTTNIKDWLSSKIKPCDGKIFF